MSYLDRTKEEIEDEVASYGLNDSMFFDLFDEAREQEARAWEGFYIHHKVFSYLLEKGYVENLTDADGWEAVADNIIRSIKNIEKKIK